MWIKIGISSYFICRHFIVFLRIRGKWIFRNAGVQWRMDHWEHSLQHHQDIIGSARQKRYINWQSFLEGCCVLHWERERFLSMQRSHGVEAVTTIITMSSINIRMLQTFGILQSDIMCSAISWVDRRDRRLENNSQYWVMLCFCQMRRENMNNDNRHLNDTAIYIMIMCTGFGLLFPGYFSYMTSSICKSSFQILWAESHIILTLIMEDGDESASKIFLWCFCRKIRVGIYQLDWNNSQLPLQNMKMQGYFSTTICDSFSIIYDAGLYSTMPQTWVAADEI